MNNKPMYEVMCDANNLMDAARQCMKGVSWKYSIQSYNLNRIGRVRKTQLRLMNFDRMSDGFIEFPINERGKHRDIRSIHINERVVHRCENDNALLPMISPSLISDNQATLKGRGITRTFNRIERQLHHYYFTHGTNEGYALTLDLHHYFDSIPHDQLADMYHEIFKYDPRLEYLTMDFIDAFGIIGLGLGSQVSQISAVAYPNDIDHMVTEQLHPDGYQRYNDDSLLISDSREFLEHCYRLIKEKYREKGIELNEKKTRITKLSQGFRFLKVRFVLTDTGKVIKRPDHKTWKRERVKLKKLKRLLDEGKISFEDVRQSYNSWRGYVSQMSTYQSVRNMDRLFNELFIKDWRNNNHGNKEKRYRDRCIKYNYPSRQPPAERRYCTVLPAEWHYIRVGHGD